jgi:nucleoid-associated protein YgaU
MERYQNTPTILGTDSINYYKSMIPVSLPIDREELPFQYIAKENDRLDTLAYAFYKTPMRWWAIAQANNLTTGALTVPAGTKLYIPVL